MTRVRNILGLIAGIMMVLSSAAHSFLGWPSIHDQLSGAKVPVDLLLGMKVSWTFGGMAMLAFGLIVITLFVKRIRRESAPLWSAALIAMLYVGIGVWAIAVTGDAFFLVFVVPGALLGIASFEGANRAAAE